MPLPQKADGDRVRELIRRIRARPWETGMDILVHGEDLTALRDVLGYNRFFELITGQLGLSARKCEACMRASQAFERHKDFAGELPAEVLLLLCQKSTPASVREQACSGWESGRRIDPSILQQWAFSARDDLRESRRRSKQSIATRREQSFRPRAIRERRQRQVAGERRFDAAKMAVRTLEPEQSVALATFLRHATPQECMYLASLLVQKRP